MSAFLEPADVEKLTGLKRPSAQLAYCKKNGIQAWLSARNEVVIPVSAVNGRPSNDSTWAPDFGALG